LTRDLPSADDFDLGEENEDASFPGFAGDPFASSPMRGLIDQSVRFLQGYGFLLIFLVIVGFAAWNQISRLREQREREATMRACKNPERVKTLENEKKRIRDAQQKKYEEQAKKTVADRKKSEAC
jgi:hypothetical protein